VPELYELTALETIKRVAKDELTVEALVRAYLDHIAEVDPPIGAWQHLDDAHAIASARALDKSAAHGLLKGLLLGVKDVITTVDMPTTFGSAAYAGYRPPYDAVVVAQTRFAEGLILGKTVSTEFAASGPGKTRNPFDPERTPGGSSSGSAAAVGSNQVQVALGTQTAGSTIRPAAFCGCVAYKPTYDFIERTGVKTLAGSFDTIGVMAKDVRDVAYYTSVVGGRPKLVVGDKPFKPKVMLYRSEAWPLAQPEADTALQTAIAALGKLGVDVPEVSLMKGFDDLLEIHSGIMDWEVRALFYEHRYLPDRIQPKTLDMFDVRIDKTNPEIYDAAVKRAYDARANIEALFGDYDVLITPPSPGEAPIGLAATGDASFNRGWTMLRAPCVTVPAGVGPNGLPVGVQVVGRPGDDARTLAAAAYLEDALKAA
jgi:Asp-tRNA(Asn)/Glu-tRNA(Gln) amidotransferase A subunit family amidase